MRGRRGSWVVLVACAVAGACGSDSKPTPSTTGGKAGIGGDAGGADDTGDGGSDVGVAGKSDSAGKSGGGASGNGGSSGSGGTSNGGSAGTDANPGMAGDGGAGGTPIITGPQPIQFTVNGAQGLHAISPLIYGANVDGLVCNDAKAKYSFCRARSSALSTYNWENNASNRGSGDCNQNSDSLSVSDDPGVAVTDLIAQADGMGASTVVTVPMLDHVALDKNSGTAAPDCSGDVSKSADYLNTRFAKNRSRKGSALSLTPDTSDGFVNQDEFLAFLKDGYGSSSLLFSLDQQPELWVGEHPKLRATPLTYDEEVNLTVEYAKMIKDGWAEAEVLGLVGYGYLAAINQQTSPDFETKGQFVSYLLDYVDLHWFAEIYAGPNNARIVGEESDPASVAARVQAPRELWDPDFMEKSWINDVRGGEPLQLLDLLQSAIDDNYPGTKLAISEWSYGGGKHISGAVAAADALGIFGQKSVGLAGAVSFSPNSEPYLVGAFEAYRNYDGQGHGFGDTSVAASSSNVALGSIYASINEADVKQMVLVAINRYDDELDATIEIAHSAAYKSIAPYVISDGHPDPVAGDVVAATSTNHFALKLPPYTVTILVPSE